MRKRQRLSSTALLAGPWILATLTRISTESATVDSNATARSEPIYAATNIAQLGDIAARSSVAVCAVRLEGTVWWSSPAEGRLVLQDESGAAKLDLDWREPDLLPGQRVRIVGVSIVTRNGAAFQMGARGPVVDNDGTHAMLEKSGARYLEAGRHPFRVEWFNGAEGFGMEVAYEGPDGRRRPIPDDALFRDRNPDTAANGIAGAKGLNYEVYEGLWTTLPDFEALTPVRRGVSPGIDIGVRSRDEHVAVRLTGYLEVPHGGRYAFFLKSDDGSRLFVGEPAMRLQVIGTSPPPPPRRMAIGQSLLEGDNVQRAEVEGEVSLIRSQSKDWQLELIAGANRMRVNVAELRNAPPASWLKRRVRAIGVCEGVHTATGEFVAGAMLVSSFQDITWVESTDGAGPPSGRKEPLPLLTTSAQVHRLKREEADQKHQVRIRGVVTCVLPEHQAVTLQDATRGLYVVDASPSGASRPALGDYLEIEGVTDPGLFAPMVNALRVRRLGIGYMPEPARPTWDQLMNGSGDAQFVELHGIITAVHADRIALLTREGALQVEVRLSGGSLESLIPLQDALVRLRGCLFATWNYVTHQVIPGQVRLYDTTVMLEQPAPRDLFASPVKTAADLRLFDSQAGPFQRVQITGQVLHVRGNEHFLTDGKQGLRFISKERTALQVGDRVDVVGFPDVSGGVAPVLKEAVARKTGHAALAEPKPLRLEEWLRAEHDSTYAQVDGVLVSARKTASDWVLELQNGVRTFAARLKDEADRAAERFAIGSRLQVRGVYAAEGAGRVSGSEIASFELLLNAASDVRVLARPPWWTLRRLLIIVAALAAILAATSLWITQLHRQVEERTAELGAQIHERQRIEHQWSMEAERARVAQDLHDELGSGLTEISMLGARARALAASDEKRNRHLDQMSDRAREMVTALDEIVWATNPKHDLLSSLISYLNLYADRFLGLANMSWHLDGPADPPEHALDSRHRYQLFLAFKEALNNVVRHSEATEVRMRVVVAEGQLRLTLSDNGRGLPAEPHTQEMDGVANMRTRLERLGGRFEIESEPGRGAALRFHLPLS
ncbi:MAG: hypothetical protein HYR88_18285 [Verrucomicrobia bacterium]|nr:hypothetical protein [Verrucomicrobiota bacterium]MBI3871088.1 hypothetical protein [Verrucomicrobiota bacterium]